MEEIIIRKVKSDFKGDVKVYLDLHIRTQLRV